MVGLIKAKKRTYSIVDVAVPMIYRGNIKKSENKDKYLDLLEN